MFDSASLSNMDLNSGGTKNFALLMTPWLAIHGDFRKFKISGDAEKTCLYHRVWLVKKFLFPRPEIQLRHSLLLHLNRTAIVT